MMASVNSQKIKITYLKLLIAGDIRRVMNTNIILQL